MYTQNKEEHFILKYFNESSQGMVLDIGANDGKTFSNSLALIERGWDAVLVEPSPTCVEKLIELHGGDQRAGHVRIIQVAIGNKTEKATFHESGHLPDPQLQHQNVSLVSTLITDEKKRWDKLNLSWKQYDVQVFTFSEFLKIFPVELTADFISIDAEGLDFDILKQIDLVKLKTRLVCIEYNENQELSRQIISYCAAAGLNKIIYITGENLLIGK